MITKWLQKMITKKWLQNDYLLKMIIYSELNQSKICTFWNDVWFQRSTFFSKISNFYWKSGHVIFEPLWCPNFIPSLKKILRAYTHARTDGTDFICPFRFPTGAQHAYIIGRILIIRDFMTFFVVWTHGSNFQKVTHLSFLVKSSFYLYWIPKQDIFQK